MPPETQTSSLPQWYAEESAKVREQFEQSGHGKAAIRERSSLIDAVIGRLWNEFAAGEAPAEGFCVAALGGYGRRTLFPFSDVDLLFLSEKSSGQDQTARKLIAPLSQSLWDLHIRVSPTTRTLAECGKLHPGNIEFNIALLDCRWICGDARLFEKLQDRVLPKMVAREADSLMQELTELARARYDKYGHTFFHLEPNIKDGPGGLRDYQVACWLAQIAELKRSRQWKNPAELLPAFLSADAMKAVEFLDSARCFLHYRQDRDLNVLTYELQSDAAAAGIGVDSAGAISANDWMRTYFRHARAINRLTVLFEEVPRRKSLLARLWTGRKSPISDRDFKVVDGRIELRESGSVEDPQKVLRLFEWIARHNLRLSTEAEITVESAIPKLRKWLSATPDLWEYLRGILLLPYAAAALRAMHRLGLLVLFFKEFQLIDSLVIRDYYHRYTVDEHSLVTIENLHGLEGGTGDFDRRFRDILRSIDHPEWLYLSLIFHDVGKGMPVESHVKGSLEAVRGVFERLRLDSRGREMVNFLIDNHLVMSATVLRRDIFDPEAVRDFSQAVGTIEKLKALTLFTYADIKAVNPEALTPWKAEMLWQLYAATENYLNRSVDDQRLYVSGEEAEQLRRKARIEEGAEESERFGTFLDGFPKRYLLMNSPQEISSHYRMYKRLEDSSAEISIIKRDQYYELTLVTTDRPFLFAKVAGTISSWGMNILKAEACANHSGIVLDTLRFSDRFQTLDHNPTESTRLKQDLQAALSGELDVAQLMRSKFQPGRQPPKVRVTTGVHLDDECSSHSTVVEIVAQDRPGLLYDISSTFAERGCNIEVALINTEGGAATDVFYVTREGHKLDSGDQQALQDALRARL